MAAAQPPGVVEVRSLKSGKITPLVVVNLRGDNWIVFGNRRMKSVDGVQKGKVIRVNDRSGARVRFAIICLPGELGRSGGCQTSKMGPLVWKLF